MPPFKVAIETRIKMAALHRTRTRWPYERRNCWHAQRCYKGKAGDAVDCVEQLLPVFWTSVVISAMEHSRTQAFDKKILHRVNQRIENLRPLASIYTDERNPIIGICVIKIWNCFCRIKAQQDIFQPNICGNSYLSSSAIGTAVWNFCILLPLKCQGYSRKTSSFLLIGSADFRKFQSEWLIAGSYLQNTPLTTYVVNII